MGRVTLVLEGYLIPHEGIIKVDPADQTRLDDFVRGAREQGKHVHARMFDRKGMSYVEVWWAD